MKAPLLTIAATIAGLCLLAGCASETTATNGGKVETNGVETHGIAATNGMKTVSLEVSNMDCTDCQGKVKEVLMKTAGVSGCDIKPDGKVDVTIDPAKTDAAQLASAVNSQTDFTAKAS